jgi:hypothetical protein
MPFLGIAKRRVADRLASVATRGEGTQSLVCAYVAAAVLVGLLGNALFGLWWLDPAAGLIVGGVALREGRQSWSSEAAAEAASAGGTQGWPRRRATTTPSPGEPFRDGAERVLRVDAISNAV